MGVEKQVLKPGNGTDFPKKHDEVAMEYTGNCSIELLCPGAQPLTHSRLALRREQARQEGHTVS